MAPGYFRMVAALLPDGSRLLPDGSGLPSGQLRGLLLDGSRLFWVALGFLLNGSGVPSPMSAGLDGRSQWNAKPDCIPKSGASTLLQEDSFRQDVFFQ